MELLEAIINGINNVIWSQYVLIPLLLFTGLFFTIKSRFLQIRMLPEMFKSITHKPDHVDEDAVSSFEAFTVGLASRVGTGNLAGVAIAIVVGGPGAVFWMWIVAILGSVSAFVESTLAQLYKVHDEEVKYRGGPAYYMRDGLGSKAMGVAFAILISLCFGLIFNAVQANTIVKATGNALISGESNVFAIFVGLFLVLLAGYILFGGAKRIAEFTSKIVPFMAIFYIIIAAVVIALRFSEIPTVISMILAGALSPEALFGGGIGITIIMGVKRGLFSNEAGMGSAPNAAASADTDHPVRQGLIQAFGVYIDTLVICSATAFIILVSGIELDPTAKDGISLTMNALGSVVGEWAIYFLLVAIFFFAFSSILGNYYYAQSNVEYLTEKPKHVTIFKVFVLAMVMFGALADPAVVWNLADVFMGLMAILNIIAILLLHKQAFFLLKDYESQLKEGKNPVFDSSKYEEYKKFEIWNSTIPQEEFHTHESKKVKEIFSSK
ncbi:sodium:alanine symporter family protein [Mollicutes bacterium LVI A0039]|nr:sodium:alanine symporter family protein [Mollicutes bacterium LVI A0039]